MLKYQKPDATMTLREGLVEYYSAFSALIDERTLTDDETRALFHGHDRCHIVFGCDTSLVDEGMVDTWTLFGSDVGFERYRAYGRTPEVRAIFRKAGYGTMMWKLAVASPRLVQVMMRARAMKKKWPFDHADDFLDRELRAIREQFGIRVVGAAPGK